MSDRDALQILREGKHAPSDMALLAGCDDTDAFRRACLRAVAREDTGHLKNPHAHVSLHMLFVRRRKRLWTGRHWQWPVDLYLRAFFNARRR